MCHSVSSLHRLKHTYCFPDVSSCLPSDAASYPRRSKCSITLLWKPQHLQCKTCDRQQTCGQGCNMHSLARFNGRKKKLHNHKGVFVSNVIMQKVTPRTFVKQTVTVYYPRHFKRLCIIPAMVLMSRYSPCGRLRQLRVRTS